MPEGDATKDPPEQPPDQSQSAPDQSQSASEQALVSDQEAQQLLDLVTKRMGGVAPKDALRRSLQTILAMYQATDQGGTPIIRYRKTKTEQQINLPGEK